MKAPQETVLRVIGMIPHGKDKAISVNSIAAGLGMRERGVREAIETARANGIVILNDYNGRGYYRTDDIDEISAAYWREKRRMKHMYQATLPMRRILKEAGREV